MACNCSRTREIGVALCGSGLQERVDARTLSCEEGCPVGGSVEEFVVAFSILAGRRS